MQKYFIFAAVLLLGTSLGLFVQPLISGDNIFEQEKKFHTVLNTAYKNYVEDVDSKKLVEAAIEGMLDELDPHSVYISEEDMKRVKEDFSGSFEGIGVQFDIINDTITIVTPISGGPSEKLGIMAGDRIVKIDGEKAVGIARSEVPKKLKGPKGTIVEVDIVRHGEEETLHFEIERDKIPLYSVDASFMIDGTDIGFIEVNRFSATTHKELSEALVKLESKGMNKLVLDLRGNPGGYLRQAFEMADEFIKGGDTIVFTDGRVKSFNEVYRGTPGGRYEEVPVIVLVNAGSASASEIVSGAIQDLDRGLVVGTTSYGKGLVQRQYDAGDGSAFRITISKYYTPSGRCIQRPYEDEEDYRRLVGRLDLEEGSYIDDAYSKIVDQVKKHNETAKGAEDSIDIETLPIFYTKTGRVVLGAGGVTPDYIVESDTITDMSVQIRKKRVFNEYNSALMDKRGEELKAKYKDDFLDFFRNFDIDDEMIADFKDLAENKGVEWDVELFEADEEFIKTSIKTNIALTIWDRSRSLQVFRTMDAQLKTAITLFDQAEKVAERRQNMR